MMGSRKPTVLIICDGWGVGASDPAEVERQGNAVAMAHTPVRDRLIAEYPWCLLATAGEAVGLPPGQMGNSEVGHLNLGAGRIVLQDVSRISMAIRDGTFFRTPALTELAAILRGSGGALHLVGLCSDGGVHSHIGHLRALLQWADGARLPVRIHCITDGRDTSPTSGVRWITEVEAWAKECRDARIVSVSGRYFAMDRDKRWSRTESAYRAIAEGAGPESGVTSVAGRASTFVERCYQQGTTDEFLPPAVISGFGSAGSRAGDRGVRPPTGIGAGDGILFFNFRADRARQLTEALVAKTFLPFGRSLGPLGPFVAMTRYEDDFPHPVLFPSQVPTRTLGEVLSRAGRTQLRMAETEKYPHVTYFFNGGVEEPFPGERRHLIPSPRVATYDMKPEMSALELTEALLSRLEEGRHDFVLVNYANADMVGHTGSIPATIAAVETVDACVGRVLERIFEGGGTALVTADHGNAEKMLDDNGRPFTAHTSFPVRLFHVSSGPTQVRLRDGILADVAPTILDLMDLRTPPEMTGRSLVSRPSPPCRPGAPRDTVGGCAEMEPDARPTKRNRH